MRAAPCRVPAGSLLLALLCLGTSTGTANATSVLVPDDYPTIQQAIDSGADTVRVREGRYEEDLEIVGGRITLLTEENPYFGLEFAEVLVGGLDAIADVTVEGLRFAGPVRFRDGPPRRSPHVRLEGCRFDSSFEVPISILYLLARGCTFYRDVTIRPYSFEIVNSTFIGAHVECGFEGDARLIGNAFLGPGEFAIKVNYHDGGLTIAGNFITGKIDGIIARHVKWARIENNEISDCAGNAVRIESDGSPIGGPSGLLDCIGNRVKNCGGHGFECMNVLATFVSNVIDSVGGDGIVSDYPTSVEGNVVGRARGHGIRLETSLDSRLLNNTVYACTGDGIRVESAWPSTDSLTANIAYANGGAGLNFSGGGAAILTCNDWHANAGGATVGIVPGVTDLDVDPLFCDVAADDVSLSSASPLLDAPGCGQIGALGQGCAASVSVLPGGKPGTDRFRVFPHPALDRVTFSWPATDAPARLEVFDVTGARRWQSDLAPGAAELSWRLMGTDGARLPAGVYWARLTRHGDVLHSRIVSIR